MQTCNMEHTVCLHEREGRSANYLHLFENGQSDFFLIIFLWTALKVVCISFHAVQPVGDSSAGMKVTSCTGSDSFGCLKGFNRET